MCSCSRIMNAFYALSMLHNLVVSGTWPIWLWELIRDADLNAQWASVSGSTSLCDQWLSMAFRHACRHAECLPECFCHRE